MKLLVTELRLQSLKGHENTSTNEDQKQIMILFGKIIDQADNLITVQSQPKVLINLNLVGVTDLYIA